MGGLRNRRNLLPGRIAAARARARARLRVEDGFGIIEILASALVAIIAGLAIFAGLDAASARSGVTKARAVAAGLAQDDHERMRALRLDELSNLRETVVRNAGGVDYTIESRADWLTDSTGSVNCATDTAQADYLRIRSTVTFPDMRGLRPIVQESVVAPPTGSFNSTQGSLAIHILKADGTGLAGQQVTVTGPETFTDTTNADGCILYGYLPVGDYTVTFSQPGFVTPALESEVSTVITVVGEATTVQSFDYDQAGQINVSFDTLLPGDTAPRPAPQTTPALGATVQHSLMNPSFQFRDVAEADGTLAFTPLYPFTDPYAAYGGNCDTDTAHYQYAAVTPGQATAVTVRVPAINIRVTSDGTTPVTGANAKLTHLGVACGTVYTALTDAQGALDRPAVPFGDYEVCVTDGANELRQTISNSDPAGTPVTEFNLSTGVAGTCA